jgi:putative membrane protein
LPPLVDQRWAGLVMFAAGMPLQLVGAWLILNLGRNGPRP